MKGKEGFYAARVVIRGARKGRDLPHGQTLDSAETTSEIPPRCCFSSSQSKRECERQLRALSLALLGRGEEGGKGGGVSLPFPAASALSRRSRCVSQPASCGARGARHREWRAGCGAPEQQLSLQTWRHSPLAWPAMPFAPAPLLRFRTGGASAQPARGASGAARGRRTGSPADPY